MTSTATADRAETGKPMIELRAVNKWYGEFHVLKDINLTSTGARASSSAGPPARASRR